jgi:N-acetyltransferase
MKPESLVGRFVQLDVLRREDVPDIAAAAASGGRETYGYGPVPSADPTVKGAEDADATVTKRLAAFADGSWIPFVQRRAEDQVIVGMTNYIMVDRRLNEPTPPTAIEIGGTWLAPMAQRTPINTEAKLLLMAYAFDELKVLRVQIKTDARNERSRNAIARLGATFEGVLRNFQPGNGDIGTGAQRDTAMYSVIASEWSDVRARLEGFLAYH